MEPNGLYNLPRCPTLVRLTPSDLTLNIYTVYQLRVRLSPLSPATPSWTLVPPSASSTELRAQADHEYVSPMMLQQQTPSFPMPALPHHFSQARSPMSSSHMQQLSNSAPANIAFQMTPMTADTDFDVSPLTSPWLGAYTQHPPASVISNKRSASPSDGGSPNKPAQKRRSSTASVIARKRATKSATSTPITITSNLAGAGSSGHDFSTPPPANPSNDISNPEPKNLDLVGVEQAITPVTPASIMNLGPLGVNSSLVPPKTRASEKRNKVTTTPATKPVTDPKATKKSSVVSPSLKPILPGLSLLDTRKAVFFTWCIQPKQPRSNHSRLL